MSRWLEKINLNAVIAEMDEKHDLSLLEEPCPDEAREAIAKELIKSNWLSRYASDIRKAKSIAAVNRILERVFDDADRFGVWCGLPFVVDAAPKPS